MPTVERTARERLLDAASELFYAEGVHTVGIDRVIERAGVAKASLYNSFGSKDELIRAYLSGRHERIRSRLQQAVDQHDDPRQKILAVFASQAEQFGDPGYRGCAFANASAESERGGTVEAAARGYRSWLQTMFLDLAAATGATDPPLLARQLLQIYDGAALSARLDHDPHAGAVSRAAAIALLDTAVPARRRSR